MMLDLFDRIVCVIRLARAEPTLRGWRMEFAASET